MWHAGVDKLAQLSYSLHGTPSHCCHNIVHLPILLSCSHEYSQIIAAFCDMQVYTARVVLFQDRINNVTVHPHFVCGGNYLTHNHNPLTLVLISYIILIGQPTCTVSVRDVIRWWDSSHCSHSQSHSSMIHTYP